MNYPSINRLFTLVCFTLPPVVGSALSFIWHGGAIWCLFVIATGRRQISRDRGFLLISLLMYIYVFINVLSVAYNYDGRHNLLDSLQLFTFVLFPFSYSIWTVSRKVDIARACILGCAISCYGALILAMYQHYYLHTRSEGGSGNAIVFAQVVTIASATCLAAALGCERKRFWFLGCAYLAGLFAVLFSLSRSSWVVIVVETLVVLFVYRNALRRVLTIRLMVLVALVAAVICLVGAPLIWGRMHHFWLDWTGLENGHDYRTSLGLRVAMWRLGLDLFMAHPLLGYGMQDLQDLIRRVLAADLHVAVGFTHFHNGVVTLLVQCGIFGTLSILGLFAAIFVLAIRALHRSADELQTFGGVVLLLLFLSYMMTGSINILIGHDILDATLMIFLIVGLYLAAGTPLASVASNGRLTSPPGRPHPVAGDRSAHASAAPAILYVCNDASYFARHRGHVAARMEAEGWAVCVATGGDLEALPAGRRMIALDVDRSGFRLFSDLKLVGQIRRAVAETGPDVVHLITMKPIVFGALALLFLPASARGRRPARFVATFPGLGRVFEGGSARGRVSRKLVLAVLRRFFADPRSIATFENDSDRRRLEALGVTFKGGTAVMLGAGLDLKSFAPRERHDGSVFRVLWASRLLHGKGLEPFISAARAARARNLDIEFVVAGFADPDHADSLTDGEIEALRHDPAIDYLGHVTAMADLLGKVDAVVLPTLYAEGLPRVLVEAAAVGLPAVASDSPGCREIVVDGVSGIILKTVSTETVLEAVLRLAGDREQARRMGRAAHDYVRAKGFSEEAVQEAFLACYGAGPARP